MSRIEQNKRVCPFSIEELTNLYIDMPISKIRKKYHIGYDVLTYWLSKYNINEKSRNELRNEKLAASIRELVNSGKTIKEIANTLHINTTKIDRIKKEYEIYSHNAPKIAPFTKEELLEEYLTSTIEEISKKYHLTGETVKYWLKEYEITTRTKIECLELFHNLKYPTKEEFLKEYNAGLTLIEFCEKYNVTQRMCSTICEKYGVVLNWKKKRQFNTTKFNGQIDRTLHDNLNNRSWILTNFPPEKYSYYTIADELDITVDTIKKRLEQFNIQDSYKPEQKRSSYENEICLFLEKNNIKFECNRRYENKYELDIFIPELNFGIEFNGTYWHREERVGKKYHQVKSLYFKNKGIKLYHIFEYDWKQRKDFILKDLLGKLTKKETIYARNCGISVITNKQIYYDFLKENHFQTLEKSAQYIFGLYHNDELISVMSFGKPRFNKNYNWELLRYTSIKNIIGGSQKLFKYFIENNCTIRDSILSYSLFSRGYSNFYKNLGFNFIGITPPNYVWVKNREVLSRYKTKKSNLPTDLTETAFMKQSGYYQVFDCGLEKYEFIVK